MFRVATYNLWHGMVPEGTLRLKEIEPVTRRRERERLQEVVLRDVKADVLLLQEVNPLQARAHRWAELLQRRPYFHRDNAGLKLGTWGFPLNLDSGLLTLLDDRHHIEWVRGLPLSGSRRAWIKQPFSLQWSESRLALMVSAFMKDWGRVLWVNTHLHHGIEMSGQIEAELAEIQKEGLISESVHLELKSRLKAADVRRAHEVETLLATLQPMMSRYNAVILGGDFNSTPDSSVMKMLLDLGFRSLTQNDRGDEEFTWNPGQNQANHVLWRDFIPALLLEDLSFNSKVVERLHKMAQSWEARPRKIDYLLGWSNTGELQAQKTKLFGFESPGSMAPSDHFGVMTEVSWSARD